MDEVSLREVEPGDLPRFFEHQSDPEAVSMAKAPVRGRESFMAHWSGILADPLVTVKTVLYGDVVAGYVASWGDGEERLVGYWMGRETWGRGVATRALEVFLAVVPRRPLMAYVAVDNVASRRVLEKCGFVERAGGPRMAADGVIEHVMILADAPERPLRV